MLRKANDTDSHSFTMGFVDVLAHPNIMLVGDSAIGIPVPQRVEDLRLATILIARDNVAWYCDAAIPA